jgi:hypothetical protein
MRNINQIVPVTWKLIHEGFMDGIDIKMMATTET